MKNHSLTEWFFYIDEGQGTFPAAPCRDAKHILLGLAAPLKQSTLSGLLCGKAGGNHPVYPTPNGRRG